MQNVFNVNIFSTNGAGIFNLSAGKRGGENRQRERKHFKDQPPKDLRAGAAKPPAAGHVKCEATTSTKVPVPQCLSRF